MDRRSKIIVSVVGIFIVLLALVGITYAYFLTQVEGNTNDTSISITTANLRLVYRDGGPNIEATNIQPGNEIYTKTFTVTNEGNTSIDYEVYLENVINNFVHEEDLLMFVTCTSNIEGNICNGYGSGSVSGNTPTFGTSLYPETNSLLIQNSIEPASTGINAETHTYTLYLKFKDDGSDQSIDMGKKLQGKIQIYDPKDVVAITGTVSGYDSSYYLEMHSEVKTSEIRSDGSYIFYGVEAEEHTIYVKKRNDDGSTSDIGSSNIEVTKGNEASISNDATTIVIANNTESVKIDVTISGGIITLVGSEIKNSKEKPSAPNLMNNSLTPVIYDVSANDGAGSWKVADTTKQWYDYDKQEWANAVILNSDVSNAPGTLIDVESQIKAMYVWIPRYEYKIEGTYGIGGTSKTNPGEIKVNFISNSQTIASEGYILHPAFTWDNDSDGIINNDEHISGIWVGKFETTGTSTEPTILPNKESIDSQDFFGYFQTAPILGTYLSNSENTDTHMTKNVEWSAAAYLSQSIYGKYGNPIYTGVNKEVYINNSSKTYTGRSSGTSGAVTVSSEGTCLYNDLTIRGDGTGSCGGGASTTGNIYGIYDMSGGKKDAVAAAYKDSLDSFAIEKGITLDYKYFDVYTNLDNDSTACDGGICYGHALTETNLWYNDNCIFLYDWPGMYISATFMSRGEYYGFDSSGNGYIGIFAYNGFVGKTSDNDIVSFRVSLLAPGT